MILEGKDLDYVVNRLNGYYGSFDRIDTYFRERKKQRLDKLPMSLFSIDDDLFSDFSMSPEDMDFRLVDLPYNQWDNYLEHISSHSNDINPGKSMPIAVQETNTGKYVGFIRLGSPTINSKPRNVLFGEVPPLDKVNQHIIMGFVIVPTQPFGFNYLGGKLLSLICCSHEVRQKMNEKWDSDICMFETTSLYGSIKAASQYDGLKPFIRYRGNTESKFLLTMSDEIYKELNAFFTKKNDGPLIHKEASSRKLKTQTKMISIVKASLKESGRTDDYDEFVGFLKHAEGLTTKKRAYTTDFGFANTVDYILGKDDKLIKKENYDRYSLDNLVTWWKNKATNRYNNLVADGRLRTEMEIWDANKMDEIDIIR